MYKACLALCLLGTVACAEDAADVTTDDGLPFDDSKADGLEAKPAVWHWANETQAEFEAVGIAHFAWDHPMVKRLQYWVDAADTALRAKYGARLDNVPKPRIFIDTSTTHEFLFGPTNALTRSQQICLTQAAKLAKPGAKVVPRLAWYNTGIVAPQLDCLERPAYAAAHKAIVDAFDRGSVNCKITDGASALTFGSRCLYSAEFTGGPKSAKATSYPAMSTYVAFEPGLIKTFASEDELVFALFHELGHYYNAHLSVSADFYNYFYALDKVAPGTTPKADPAYASLTKSVRGDLQNNLVQKFQYHFTDEDTRVESQHLGFYTVEQEADDFAIELMTLAGVDPGVSIAALLDLARTFEAANGAPADGMTAAKCSALAAHDWTDSAGKPVHVPVGTIANLHHTPCFRAWNLAREIDARGYHVDPAQHPSPPGPAWSTLVGQL